MGRKKKTYLDFYLDNSDSDKKKKKGNYFTAEHELAILKFNDGEITERERNEIFNDVILEVLKDTVDGVLEMPKFHKLPKSMDKDQLIEETLNRLVEKINKFTPDRIGKNGQPAKAFSYFSTIAKNFILEKKIRHEKILKNKADVESSIDLSILSEDTLKMMSNYDKMDVHLDDYQTMFNSTRNVVMKIIQEVIAIESAKNKRDEDFIKIGLTIEYLLVHWDKIEFKKKNEFMRILTLYTGLKQQQVSMQFKKFKIAVLKKLRPNGVSKVKKIVMFDDIDDLDDDIIEDLSEDELLDDMDMDIEDIEEPEEVINPRANYSINSMEEFEMYMELESNDGVKANIKNKKNVNGR